MGDAEVENALRSRLQFGTAGLRGPMGAGYNRMNDLVILQTCQGIVDYINKVQTDNAEKSVIIGYDHRRLGTISSKDFARISAAVFLSKGFKVYMLEGYVPTPFVAFGVTHLKCAAGIMVTASHNPKADNGFKVYWDTGSQIIPPHDSGITSCILANLCPWEKYDISTVESHPNAVDVTNAVADAYYSSITSLCDHKELNSKSNVKTIYTAMHGVGTPWVQRSFELFGHQPLVAVPSQSAPDAEFTTVVFPNPEEKGALDESFKFANETNSTLIIANDPDADRLAVAERPSASSNTWHSFSGNEIGVLLGHWQITRWKKNTQNSTSTSTPPVLLASVVSSRMLKAVAKAEGCMYQDTLTGFKWLGDAALKLRASGVPVIFSYEEALGYCVGDVVVDKDGVSAAAVFMEMATWLMSNEGKTVKEHLGSLYDKYGEFRSYNSYIISHDAKVTDEIFDRLRTAGPEGKYWTSCVGVQISTINDVTMGYDSSSADGSSTLPETPGSHMIMFEFANGCSVTLRTSGTEPKIKYYTEIAGKVGQTREELDLTLISFVDQLVEEMLQPTQRGLAKA